MQLIFLCKRIFLIAPKNKGVNDIRAGRMISIFYWRCHLHAVIQHDIFRVNYLRWNKYVVLTNIIRLNKFMARGDKENINTKKDTIESLHVNV